MASRLGRRVVHFANLPLKLVMPSSRENIKEVAFKTIPSASKIEIKRVLESLYGLEVEKVQTLNMQGKKKRRGGIVFAKPDYKKAYVTLKHPVTLPPNLFPINIFEEGKDAKQQEEAGTVDKQGKLTHWLEDSKDKFKPDQRQSEKRKAEASKKLAPWHSKLSWR